LILFHYRACGDPRPDSDIDLVVLLDGAIDAGADNRRTSELRARINLDTELEISCRYFTPERLAKIDSPLLLNLSRDGVRV
jgi:predicted nucleotidyltransferase